nr:zinc finger, CCHC-type [Tanacetum cinerariifolium]
MDNAAMKHMASNFVKLDKFKGVKFRIWQKKMHFFLFSMSVVYVLTNTIPEDDGDDATVEHIKKGPSGTMMTMSAEVLSSVDSDKPKGNNVAGLSVVNMVEHNNSS